MLCRGSSCLEGGRARGRARARARRPQKPKPAPHPELEGYAGHDATLGKAQRRRLRRRLGHSTCPAAQRPAMRAFPFGGSRTAGRCTVQVTLPGTASREGSVPLGVLCAAGSRGYWVPRSRQVLGISAGSSGIVRPPSTASSRTRLHPPSSVPPPSESCDRRPALRTPDDLATARRPESASRGVPIPSSRHQQATSTDCPEFPRSELMVHPRRFARPRRFAPSPALRVCFAPQPRPGFALQGIVPLRGAVPAFAGRFMPSWRWMEAPAV